MFSSYLSFFLFVSKLLISVTLAQMQTFLTQRIAHHFVTSGQRVLLSATTGAAANNLSRSASTVHDNFVIPVSGWFRTIPLHSPTRIVLTTANVFVIDEMSMLKTETLNLVLNRLMQLRGFATVEALLASVLILLVRWSIQLSCANCTAPY